MKKIEILYLDDMAVRHEKFETDALRVAYQLGINIEITHVWTSDEAISVLSNQKKSFDVISLDHDLRDEHYEDLEAAAESGKGTGFEVAKFLSENPEKVGHHTFVLIHSWNIVGAENMQFVLRKGNIVSNSIRYGNHIWMFQVFKAITDDAQ